MGDYHENAARHRAAWATALVHLTEADAALEIRQMLLDAIDAREQSHGDLESRLIAACRAFAES